MTALVFFLLLSVLVLVHEFGHFLAARVFGVEVEEFGIGLPPKARTLFTRGKTMFTLNWLPLGGFVRLLGEEREAILNPLKRARAFFVKPSWQRAIILVSGALGNFLLGVVLFSVVYSVSGVPRPIGERVMVVEVSPGSPADHAGITQGDVFVRVAGDDVESTDAFIAEVDARRGEMLQFFVGTFEADGTLSDSLREVTIIPRDMPPEGEGSLGVAIVPISELQYEKKPWYAAPFYGVVIGTREAFFWGREVLSALVDVVGSIGRGVIPEGLAGPWGIYEVTGEVRAAGTLALLRFAAILSINLALFNLLPIPALDGGRLLFLGFEAVLGQKRVARFSRYVHSAGFVLLILLLLLITWNDIRK